MSEGFSRLLYKLDWGFKKRKMEKMKFTKSNITRKSLKVSFFVLFLCLLSPTGVLSAYQIESVASAQINNGFVVSPGKVEVELKSGGKKIVPIKVLNHTGSTKTFSIGVEDFSGSKNPLETVLLLGSERGPYSLKDYLRVDEKSFELKNNEQATVPVYISIPTDAEPSGLYGALIVSTASGDDSTSRGTSAVISRLGVLFFVKVSGNIFEQGQVVSFETAPSGGFLSHGPITFRLLYENTGSAHLNPYGQIKIKNIFGKEVGTVTLDPWFTMPQSLRLREISWNKTFLFGRYRAEASVNRGYSDIVDSNSLSFWVIPWWVSVIAVALIILIAGFFIVLKIFRGRAMRK